MLRPPRSVLRLRHLRGARTAVGAPPIPGRLPIRLATITDPFTHQMLAGAAELIPLHPLAWREQLRRHVPDLLFVESAWTGPDGWWRYDVSHRAGRSPDRLAPLLAWCRTRGIPTVFWNKEDPARFEGFFDATEGFDLIATTEERAAAWYEALRPGVTVVVMPFAVNPTIHHPVRSTPELRHGDRVLFAGSWSHGHYPARTRTLGWLLDAAANRQALDVYTRKDTGFPDRFRPFMRGTLSPADVIDVSRAYAAVLNVNSVPASRTMVSRRLFESLGCGVPVISSPTPALRELFDDVVLGPSNDADLAAAFECVFDPGDRADRSAAGWRVAHRRHAVDVRLSTLFDALGLDCRAWAPDATGRPPRSDWCLAHGHGPADEVLLTLASRFSPVPAVMTGVTEARRGVHVASAPWSRARSLLYDRSRLSPEEVESRRDDAGAAHDALILDGN